MTRRKDRPGVRLARRLRQLREHEWPEISLTQAQLARAFSAQSPVTAATLGSWESITSTQTPPVGRLGAYARFFATRRSAAGTAAQLLALADLDEAERDRCDELERELYALHAAADYSLTAEEPRRTLLAFEGRDPVVIICPEVPEGSRGRLADEHDVNYSRLHRYADVDALIEVFGHLRAMNPDKSVVHRLPSSIQLTELQDHLVLLGGVGWNKLARRIQSELRRLPVEQIEDDRLPTGEVFRLRKSDGYDEATFFPVMVQNGGDEELVEDIALLARLPNPFNSGRTLTICNGIHSAGVVGAVLAIADETVRAANEKYLASRFPVGDFAMLLKVPVVSGTALAPDLWNPDMRVFEWTPEE